MTRRDLRGVPVALELVAAPRYRRTARRPHAEHRATANPRTLLRELRARVAPLAY